VLAATRAGTRGLAQRAVLHRVQAHLTVFGGGQQMPAVRAEVHTIGIAAVGRITPDLLAAYGFENAYAIGSKQARRQPAAIG
jgi:hypothetical protein